MRAVGRRGVFIRRWVLILLLVLVLLLMVVSVMTTVMMVLGDDRSRFTLANQERTQRQLVVKLRIRSSS